MTKHLTDSLTDSLTDLAVSALEHLFFMLGLAVVLIPGMAMYHGPHGFWGGGLWWALGWMFALVLSSWTGDAVDMAINNTHHNRRHPIHLHRTYETGGELAATWVLVVVGLAAFLILP